VKLGGKERLPRSLDQLKSWIVRHAVASRWTIQLSTSPLLDGLDSPPEMGTPPSRPAGLSTWPPRDVALLFAVRAGDAIDCPQILVERVARKHCYQILPLLPPRRWWSPSAVLSEIAIESWSTRSRAHRAHDARGDASPSRWRMQQTVR
jgi:hypothetical protein